MPDTVVEVLYNYDSTTERDHGVHVVAGQRFRLICSEDNNWWYVGKNLPSMDGFYLPKSYLRVVTNGQSQPDGSTRFGRTNDLSLTAAINVHPSSSSSSSPLSHCGGGGDRLLQNRRMSSSTPIGLEKAGLTLEPLTIGTDPERCQRRSVISPPMLSTHKSTTFKESRSNHGHSNSLDNGWTPALAASTSANTTAEPTDLLHFPRTFENSQKHCRSRSPIYANVQNDINSVPVITADMEPIRALPNGWLEYVSVIGRPFYYHPATGLSTWKPPRSLNTTLEQYSSGKDGSATGSGSTDDDDETTEPCLNVRSVNSSLDQQTTSEHCVRVSVQDFSELNRLLSASQHLSFQRSRSSLTASMYNPCMSSSDGAFKLANFLRPSRKVIKCGNLSRCKTLECGKRVSRKHWFTCFVYLTSAHMIFYKDEKASEKQGNQYAAPLGVCDLRGAKIKWLDDDKARRKRLFQLELVDGTAYMFHADSEVEIVDWYETLKDILANLSHLGYSRTPVIERGSTKLSSMRKQPPLTCDGKAFAADSKQLISTSKDRTILSESLSVSSVPDGVDTVVPSKQSILEKLVNFFRSRPSIEFLKERGIYKPEPVFGSCLSEICRREKNAVPKFVTVCTALIEERGLDTDGLYRMSGNLSQIQKIRCSVDQDKYNPMMNENDIHVLTGTLKLFFRELQDPLFPQCMMKDFMNSIKLQNPKLRFLAFKDLVGRLPPPHYNTLNVLLAHLLKVAEKSSKNRMQIHNLAIVFGPTLFSSSPKPEFGNQRRKKKKKSLTNEKFAPLDSTEMVQSNSHLAFSMIMHGQIVEYMLKEHGKLFRPVADQTG